MTPEYYYDLEQGSDEWFAVRAGVPKSSEFSKVCAKVGPRGGTSGREYVGRVNYMRRLAGEIIRGVPEDTYQNEDMRTGQLLEPDAIALYGFVKDVEPARVGFVKNGNCGASPDATIAGDGLVEIKSTLKAHIHIARLQAGVIPPEHAKQCLGQLMVTDRAWVDFMSYCPGLPPFIKRLKRDEKEIAELREAVDRFVAELNQLVEWLRRM